MKASASRGAEPSLSRYEFETVLRAADEQGLQNT